MSTILNSISKSTEEVSEMVALCKEKELKLLLVLSFSGIDIYETLLAGADFTIIKDVSEAKQIIQTYGETFFDGIICDSELGKKPIMDFVAFFNSNGILKYTPLLLLASNTQMLNKPRLNNIDGIDDIVPANISAAELADKILILRKYKFLQDKMPYKIEALKNKLPDYQHILKRILDILLSGILILLTSPITILIAVCIKLESKGPVFYKSKRAGKWYKVFTFYKFRTMVVNADNMVADLQSRNEYKDFQTSFFFKLKDDPRVTRIGKFLRRTSLDELPQLLNVLKGDMSLVGNRPLPLYEAQTITVDKSAKRFFASAGITGLWQVEGRTNYNLTVQERINMDIAYADNSSFFYDLKILLKTPKELIHKSNV